MGRTLAIIGAAVLAATLGLIVSVRLNGPGALLQTSTGRWLAERIAPSILPVGVHAISEGDTIGALALRDLDGHPQTLPTAHGHRVLINIWASWCEPCRDEMPLLSAFAKSQGTHGIVMLGLAQDDPAAIRGYLLRTPVDYPILLDDAQGRAGVRLGNRLGALPYSALIDADGRLLRRKYGPFSSTEALEAWVSAP